MGKKLGSRGKGSFEIISNRDKIVPFIKQTTTKWNSTIYILNENEGNKTIKICDASIGKNSRHFFELQINN